MNYRVVSDRFLNNKHYFLIKTKEYDRIRFKWVRWSEITINYLAFFHFFKRKEHRAEQNLVIQVGVDIYNVENIIDHRSDEDGEVLFKIKWKGYPMEECTWEPFRNLNCFEILASYFRRNYEAQMASLDEEERLLEQIALHEFDSSLTN